MPSWIVQMKENFEQPLTQSKEIDTSSFSEMQRFAFNMVTKHSENTEESLLLIINGEAGTGKSYLINALRNHLQHRCIVTATTGKSLLPDTRNNNSLLFEVTNRTKLTKRT